MAWNRQTAHGLALITCLAWTGCGDSTAPIAQPEKPQEGPAVVTLGTPLPQAEATPGLVPALDPHDSEGVVQVAALGNLPGGVQSADLKRPGATLDPAAALAEIGKLRAQPLDVVQRIVPGTNEVEEVQLTPDQVAAEQTRRLYRILDLAVQVIGQSYQDPAQSESFNAAVVALSEARLQLVFLGDEKQGDLLQEDAETLFRQDPTSFAAVEASFKVLQMTQTLAQQHLDDPVWRIAFARQARLFTERFPLESSRATVGLASAGEKCNLPGTTEEARLCFQVLQSKFPESPFTQQCAGALRRLELEGQPLTEFGGQTLDGNTLDLNRYAGKPLLIVFWSTTAPQFAEDLQMLKQALNGPGGKEVQVVGVNLDTDEQAVRQFVDAHQFHCPHVFYADPSLRGEQNLVANYYGVKQVPAYWLIGADGLVQSVYAQPAELAQKWAQ